MAKQPNNLPKYILIGLVAVCLLVALFGTLVKGKTIAVFHTAGPIGHDQRSLIIFATVLSLIVVVPVFILLAFIAWRYREGNTKAPYKPDWDHSRSLESLWWGLPLLLIVILSVVTWQSTHRLDTKKPIAATTPAMHVQVVALDWKWLFLYPDQQLASVNELYVPAGTPVTFSITADAPMNSFWVPQLGGQIYAMSGMTTQLNLMADKPGDYRGVSANISGKGFAGMTFTVHALAAQDFDTWVSGTRLTAPPFTMTDYHDLVMPSENVTPSSYQLQAPKLFEEIVNQYSPHGHKMDDTMLMGHDMHESDHFNMSDMEGEMQ